MKKLTLILVVLLTVGLVGAFAEVTVSGDLEHVIEVGEDTSDGMFTKGRIYFDSEVDEYNSVNFSLQSIYDAADPQPTVRDFKVMTDLSGALGIDGVSIDTTIGRFWSGFTTWNDPTWHDLRGLYPALGRSDAGAIQVDVGVDMFTLHWANDFEDGFNNFIGGVSGNIDAATFMLSYAGDAVDPDKGDMYAEVSYDLAIDDTTSVFFPATFKYNLDADALDGDVWGYNAGFKATYDLVTLGFGVSGDDDESLRNIDVDINAAVTENANIYAAAYANLPADDTLQGMEVGANYMFGALKLQAGYFVEADTSVQDDYRYGWYGSPAQSGFYLATDIAW